MTFLAESLSNKWFFAGAIILAVLYGMGGVVHIGNMLGFGEMRWLDSPLAWKLGDVWWGSLDAIAVVGIVMRKPFGLVALIVAAVTQVIVYGLFAEPFILKEEHRATIRGMVYFNATVLVCLCVGLYSLARLR